MPATDPDAPWVLDEALTVGELIEQLSRFPDNYPVELEVATKQAGYAVPCNLVLRARFTPHVVLGSTHDAGT